MKTHTATAEEREWMGAIVEMGCCVCLREMDVHTPAEVHHLYGKTKPGSHLLTIPLCYAHHRGGVTNDRVTSRHPFKTRFEARYGSEEDLYQWTVNRIGQTRQR